MKKIRWFFGLYTKTDIMDFGNYLLENRRTFKGHENLRWFVFTFDFCNWIENNDNE